jgi:hypothetical protein
VSELGLADGAVERLFVRGSGRRTVRTLAPVGAGGRPVVVAIERRRRG